MNTVYLDLETSYELLGSWGGLFDLDRLFTIRDVMILSIAWAVNDGPVRCVGVWDFPGYKPGEEKLTDRNLVKFIYEKILPDATMVVAHNGASFDFKIIRTRGLIHNLPPPAINIERDTKKMAKAIGRFTSNKQDNIIRQLGMEKVRKFDTGGLTLWRECIAGNKAAQRKMVEYNKRDVVGLREMHKKLEPWMRTGPNMNVIQGKKLCCSSCGSHDVKRRGRRFTNTGSYYWYFCESCRSCRTRGPNIPSGTVLR